MRLIPMTLAAAILLSFGARAQSKAKPPQPEAPPLALPTQPDLVLPLPSSVQPPLDLSPFLKNTSLCVFPFLKESARGSSDKAYLDSIQKTFFDVAKESPLLKDAVLMGPSLCDVRDMACFSEAGKQARCQNVLVGSSAAKGNGYVLSVRMVEVGKNRIMPGSEVEQVLETDRQSDVQAWAEGQACRALQVKCVGRIAVDADRKDMNIYVDNRLAPRTFKTPEQIAVEPGVHGIRVSVGQRTSLEKKVAVRRNGFSDLVYARQTDKGGLPLTLASELKGGAKPGPSVDVQGGWQHAVGATVGGVGVAVAAIGAFELLHGRSQTSSADNAAGARGGAYTETELSTLSSAHTAQRTGAALLIASGVMIAAGAVLFFAF
jgi:hypothetical protein